MDNQNRNDLQSPQEVSITNEAAADALCELDRIFVFDGPNQVFVVDVSSSGNGDLLVDTIDLSAPGDQWGVRILDSDGNVIDAACGTGSTVNFSGLAQAPGFTTGKVEVFFCQGLDLFPADMTVRFRYSTPDTFCSLSIFVSQTCESPLKTCQPCPEANPQTCCQVVVERRTQLVPPADLFLGPPTEDFKFVEAAIEAVCAEKVVVCGVVRKQIHYVDRFGHEQLRQDDIPFQCFIDREDANEGDTFHVVGADILCEVFAEPANFSADGRLAFKWVEKDIVKVCIQKGPAPTPTPTPTPIP